MKKIEASNLENLNGGVSQGDLGCALSILSLGWAFGMGPLGLAVVATGLVVSCMV